ncbi:MAG: metal-dependent hydrolase [Spirochaetes bacterium]|nr:metal-dependent hydrolase [Spirochaetota bacterium]
MKGIAHFMTGVAISTFFGQAVKMAASDQSFILLLGGIFGILPDTLDFKFGRYMDKPDIEIDPDPANINPQAISKQIANAANKAWTTGKPVQVQLHTVKLAAFKWRRYAVMFDSKKGEVITRVGPVVSTSQIPYPDTEPKEKKDRTGKAKLQGKLKQELQKPSVIDIMSGPSFKFEKKGDYLNIEFLPWHRQWSHSFTMGAFLALLVGIFFGALAGLISFLAFSLHIAEDLFGFMGGNLLYPFTKDRTRGAHAVKASSPLANFLIVYACIVIIIYNLNRFADSPVIQVPAFLYFIITFVIPAGLLYFVSKFSKLEDITQKDKTVEKMLEETDDVDDEFL